MKLKIYITILILMLSTHILVAQDDTSIIGDPGIEQGEALLAGDSENNTHGFYSGYSVNTRNMCQIVWSSMDREANHA